jgi:hypothetical protein
MDNASVVLNQVVDFAPFYFWRRTAYTRIEFGLTLRYGYLSK